MTVPLAAQQNPDSPDSTQKSPTNPQQPAGNDPANLIPDDLSEDSLDTDQDPAAADRQVNAISSGQTTQSLLQFNDQSGRSYSLDIMAAADFLGQWDNDEPHTTGNRFDAREVEFGFMADIDHIAEGTVMAAAHQEAGETVFELHEAYFYIPSTPIPNLSARVGQFFLDVGRLNTIHRHDWLFSVAPEVHEEMLDEEGAEDSGLELSYLIPWPWQSFVQELTVGAFNGRTFGHTHNDGDNKNNPLYTAHLKQFIGFNNAWGTQFGFSYLRYHPSVEPHKVMHQSGLDWFLKWKPDVHRSLIFQTEVWYRETREKNERPYDPAATPVETRVGVYSLLEFQFHRQWSAGYRYDFYTNPNYINEDGIKQKENGHAGNMLQLTWRPSEFSYFRATAQRNTTIETGKNTYQFFLQGTFIIGMHPAHSY
ncbi:MAG: hypothetical protein KDK39_10010 [Leptospiraceae bacterium]|nr:hypothetical protein [Leptospiraceae bacterium]